METEVKSNTSQSATIQGIQEEQKAVKKKVRNRWIIGGVIGLAFIGAGTLLYFLLGQNIFIIIGTGILVLATYYITMYSTFKMKKKVKDDFRTQVVKPMLKERFPYLEYIPEGSIARSEFIESGLFHSNDVDFFRGEDLMQGKKDKTTFRISELHVHKEEVTYDSDGSMGTKNVEIFKGIFMVADLNKKIEYTTTVLEESRHAWDNIFSGGTKVKLENPEFEKIFNTYSENQQEARYLLTPAMMERILDIRKRLNQKIILSFKGNHVYIAIDYPGNLFYLRFDKKFDEKQVDKTADQIDTYIKLIDELDLNTRLWTKQ